MIPKALDSINEHDLKQLKDNQVSESKTIDYKLVLPGDTNDERKEFLKDVSALANSDGGDLLYGVREQGGLPIDFPGIQVDNQDKLRLQLESQIRDGIRPRIPEVGLRFVSVTGGGSVLVIRVGGSWAAPHRMVFAGHGHFYARNSAGAYQLDVDQLREAFVRAQALEDRIRQFRIDRAEAMLGSAPIQLAAGGLFMMHVIPLSAFTSRELIPMAVLRNSMDSFTYFSLGSGSGRYRPNLDGVLNAEACANGRDRLYTQAYRNGCVETVCVFEPRGNAGQEEFLWPAEWCERQALKALKQYTDALFRMGIVPPLYVFLSLVQASGYRLDIGDRYFSSDGAPLDRDMVLLPEAVIESEDYVPGLVLKPAFDMVWNAFGYNGTLFVDPAGKWVGT